MVLDEMMTSSVNMQEKSLNKILPLHLIPLATLQKSLWKLGLMHFCFLQQSLHLKLLLECIKLLLECINVYVFRILKYTFSIFSASF